MDFVTNNIAPILGVLVVVIGLFVIGLRDLARFSLKRTWAISGVCFDESIRRRVLWITPLAILGVIIVTQLTRPFDEQDAIRQTIKFSLFATGLLVALVTIILAATNLPKEIDNRVIYTVVTKPTTRLEIVVGKVLGFARVSATILLIMGLFTWGYLGIRAWSLQNSIAASLESDMTSAVSRSTLEHYAEYGLLTARTYEWPATVQLFARDPAGEIAWFSSGGDGSVSYPFNYKAEDFIAPGQQSMEDGSFVVIVAEITYERGEESAPPPDLLDQFGIATDGATASPSRPSPMLRPQPRVQVQIVNPQGIPILTAQQVTGSLRGTALPEGGGEITIPLNPDMAAHLAAAGPFLVQIAGLSTDTTYGVRKIESPEQSPVRLLVVGAQSQQSQTLHPNPGNDAAPLAWFRGREGNYGQQLPGSRADDGPVAIYQFRDAMPHMIHAGRVPFEMRAGIERSGAEVSADDDNNTELELTIVNNQTGAASEPTVVRAESNRHVYFDLPADALAGGNFDLLIRNATPGHWVGLRDQSVQMIIDSDVFVWNLLKSLLVLWLMSVLVIIVAIFCSIWLSWPIAIVLSVVILLGHWGAQQVGDHGGDLGQQVAREIFSTNAPQARVVSSTVNAMNQTIQTISAVLPDISQFAATEDLERGVSISASRLANAAGVAFGFGIPLMVLGYIFLRNKEVAP